MPLPFQVPDPNSTENCDWSWLQARIARQELLAASDQLDRWIDDQLSQLESIYQRQVTSVSKKQVAKGILHAGRRGFQ